MSERLRTLRDPYSDNPHDYVVWDDDTFGMPFNGTKRQCDLYRQAIFNGESPGKATHFAMGGRS